MENGSHVYNPPFDDGGTILGYGIKTMPDLRGMGLLPQQRVIFEHYGFPPDGW